MSSKLLKLAKQYIKSGLADEERLANLSQWRRHPSRYRVENFSQHLVMTSSYKELHTLCLDSKFILCLSRFIPERPDAYRSLVRTFLRKRTTTPEMLARVGVIDRIFERLAIGEMQDDAQELSDYINERFNRDVRRRFVFILILYSKRLMVDRKIRPNIRENLQRAIEGIKIDLKSENALYSNNDINDQEDLKIDVINRTVQVCFPVILDFDSQLTLDLVPLLGFTSLKLVAYIAEKWKPCNRDIISKIIIENGPVRLKNIPPSSEQTGRTFIFLSDQLSVLRVYEQTGALEQGDLIQVASNILWILQNPDCWKQDEQEKHIYNGIISKLGGTGGMIRHLIDRQIFELKDSGCDLCNFFLLFVDEHLAQAGNSPYDRLSSRLIEWSKLFPYKEITNRVSKIDVWNDFWSISKLWYLAVSAALAHSNPSYKEFYDVLAEQQIPLIHRLYARPIFLFTRWVVKLDEKKFTKQQATGFFEFTRKKGDRLGLNEVAESYLAGEEQALRAAMLGSSSLPSNFSRWFRRGGRLTDGKHAKVIRYLCKRSLFRSFIPISRKKCQPFAGNMPRNINRPRCPLTLPIHYLHWLRVAYRRNAKLMRMVEFTIKTDLDLWEYTVPSRLLERFFYVPMILIDLAREERLFWTFPLDLFHAWQLKRSLRLLHLLRSYRADKRVQRYAHGVAERFGAAELWQCEIDSKVDTKMRKAPRVHSNELIHLDNLKEEDLSKLFGKPAQNDASGFVSPDILERILEVQTLESEQLESQLSELCRDVDADPVGRDAFRYLYSQGRLRCPDTPFYIDKMPLLDGWEPEELQKLQQAAATVLSTPIEFEDELENEEHGPRMVLIPPGVFVMGLRRDEDFSRCKESLPIHKVMINKPFALAKCPVTVGEFNLFVEVTGYTTQAELSKNGAYFPDLTGSFVNGEGIIDDANWLKPYIQQNESHPVVCVTRDDAEAYIQWLSEQTGQNYRLPSEAKWEYTCRCGTVTPFFFGTRYTLAQLNAIGGWGEEKDKYRSGTTPVGIFPANHWGLHDMHGNVDEWVADCYTPDYEDATDNGDPVLSSWAIYSGGIKRGGSWVSTADKVRSGIRSIAILNKPHNNLGFRVARDMF